MRFASTGIELARELDRCDELASFREEFVITDSELIYLDGNSLGRLSRKAADRLHRLIEHEWGDRLIRSWNEGWISAPQSLGAKIAGLVGAHPDEVLVTDATSVNLFKLAVAALRAQPERRRIVSDVLNFPSDLYILQGVVDLLGGRHHISLIPSADGMTVSPAAVEAVIDADTALVCLTHVAFKSAFMYDMRQVTEQAHRAGALVLWDLSHSVGAVPIDLDSCQVDLAVGCTYKYLNGGPGAPAFLYVRRDLQTRLSQPIWGWFAVKDPFAFDLIFEPAQDIARFRVGTPPVLSMMAIEPAVELLAQAGIPRLRAKSIHQTEYLIYLADQWLLPLGFTLGSPRQSEQRGSHISLRHPEGYRITRSLIEPAASTLRVIPDFRFPDNIRLGIAPLYTTFVEIHRALERLRSIVRDKEYERFPMERLSVT